MGQKGKSMWIYCGLVFFVVVLLIIISVTSRVGLDPLYDETAAEEPSQQEVLNYTMQQSVSDLTAYNQKLADENARLREELNAAQAQDSTQEQMVQENLGFLITAAQLYIGGAADDARQMLQNVNVNVLDETYRALYDTLAELL